MRRSPEKANFNYFRLKERGGELNLETKESRTKEEDNLSDLSLELEMTDSSSSCRPVTLDKKGASVPLTS